MSKPRYEWDYDYWPPNRPTERLERNRAGVYTPVQRRAPARPVGFMSCVLIVTVAMATIIMFAWPVACLARP